MISPRLLALAALCTGTWAPGALAATPEQVAAKAGCMACHLVDKKLVGPSYRDVAAKYKGQANAPALLFQRVRKGGPGVWGPVPMAPTDVSKLSDADLKATIAWVLKTP